MLHIRGDGRQGRRCICLHTVLLQDPPCLRLPDPVQLQLHLPPVQLRQVLPVPPDGQQPLHRGRPAQDDRRARVVPDLTQHLKLIHIVPAQVLRLVNGDQQVPAVPQSGDQRLGVLVVGPLQTDPNGFPDAPQQVPDPHRMPRFDVQHARLRFCEVPQDRGLPAAGMTHQNPHLPLAVHVGAPAHGLTELRRLVQLYLRLIARGHRRHRLGIQPLLYPAHLLDHTPQAFLLVRLQPQSLVDHLADRAPRNPGPGPCLLERDPFLLPQLQQLLRQISSYHFSALLSFRLSAPRPPKGAVPASTGLGLGPYFNRLHRSTRSPLSA